MPDHLLNKLDAYPAKEKMPQTDIGTILPPCDRVHRKSYLPAPPLLMRFCLVGILSSNTLC